jgi:serine/threonine-protein kinase
MQKDAAVSALHAAGFNVAIEYAQSAEPEDTVIDQDPSGGSRLVQTGTVTITVARGSPEPETVPVPNVVGMSQADATAVLERAGFGVRVVFDQACDPDDPECEYVQGAVWSQSPTGEAEAGATVTIVVNP